MTPIVLLEQLKAFVEEQVKDIILPVRPTNNKMTDEYRESLGETGEPVTERPPEVHLMQLPTKDAETNRIPYIVLQVLTGTDSQAAGQEPESECQVRIVAMTYNTNQSEGMMSALNVITRLRIALLRAGKAGQFLIRSPLEYALYQAELNPYYAGDMVLIFEMPAINRETNLLDFEEELNYGE